MESKKRNNIGTILGIVMLLIMIIGVTYAAFQYTKKGTKENSIETGTISFKYNETNNGITLSNAFPMNDEEGKKLNEAGEEERDNGYFDFDVTSTMGSGMEIQYYVYGVDVTGEIENKLDPKYVKVYLTDQSSPENPYEGYDKTVPVYSSLDNVSAVDENKEAVEGKLLYQNKFTESGEHLYRLRLWVSEDYEESKVAETFMMRVDVNTEAVITPNDTEKPKCEIVETEPQTVGANQDVELNIKCTDDNGTVTSNMTSDNIHVKVNGEEVEPTKKELTEGVATASVTGENGVEHKLTLSGFEKDGPLSLTIDEGVLEDQYKNTNEEQNLETPVTIDATGPVCTLESYFPTKTITKDKTVELVINCTDKSGISKDLTEDGLKITVGDEEETELTKEITNTEEQDKGKKYTVEVKGFTKTGKIGASINAAALQDTLQNPNKETPLDMELEIDTITKTADDIIKDTNPTDTEYSEETKDSMFEVSQPDGSTGYRYLGNTEKNYVNLLGTDDGKTDANLWRIIGVFDDPSTKEGTTGEYKIKLMLDQKLNNTDYSWDQTGSNNWNRPAGLRTTLNDLFWNSQSGTCSSGSSTTSCNFTSYGMSSVQDKIEEMKWHLGAVSSTERNTFTTQQWYTKERGNTAAGAGGETTWNGYVGLPYPSDYGYTFKGANDGCFKLPYQCYSGGSTTSPEPNASWMFNSDYWWTITSYSSDSNLVFCIGTTGRVNNFNAGKYSSGVRPVVYLKSSIGITGGKGTKTEPYTVGEKSEGTPDIDTTSPICSIESVTPESPTYEDEVQVKIKCTDDKSKVRSKLTNDDIAVKLNGEQVMLSTKELSSASEIENGIEYTLTLNGFEKGGSLSLTIPANKVTDESGNSNIETSLTVANIKGKGKSITEFSEEHTNSGNGYSSGSKESHEMYNVGSAKRYIGNDPYNYLKFEGDSSNTVWRIIGIFKDPSSTNDTSERLKIMRNESIGNIQWDSSNSNNWTKPASLQTTLNSGTFWTGLAQVTKDKIEEMKWYVGALSWDDNRATTTFYSGERGTTTWPGKVGLIYPSDYGYTYANGVSNVCYNTPSNSNCTEAEVGKGWMWLTSTWQWTITPCTLSANSVFIVDSGGYGNVVYNGAGDTNIGVRPVVYLTSDTQIKSGGSGQSTDPYIVAQ